LLSELFESCAFDPDCFAIAAGKVHFLLQMFDCTEGVALLADAFTMASGKRMINDNSSPEMRPNKGRNTAKKMLLNEVSYPNVSPKEQRDAFTRKFETYEC